jgi:hypothetical protein
MWQMFQALRSGRRLRIIRREATPHAGAEFIRVGCGCALSGSLYIWSGRVALASRSPAQWPSARSAFPERDIIVRQLSDFRRVAQCRLRGVLLQLFSNSSLELQ